MGRNPETQASSVTWRPGGQNPAATIPCTHCPRRALCSANSHSKFGRSLAFSGQIAPGHNFTLYSIDVTAILANQSTALTRPRPSVDLSGERTSPRLLAREVWKATELLIILTRKEFHVRYRRAAFGMLWALALPLLQSVVMAVVFSRVARFNLPHHFSYAVFVLGGMAPWTYFTMALGAGSTSIVDSSDLSSRVYFPRALLPITQVTTALYGYLVTLSIVLALCPILGVGLGFRAFLVIPGTLLLVALTLGFVLTFSALHVYFRDVRYLVSAAMILWLYITPIIYPPFDIPHTLRSIININPLTGVVDLFHYATIGSVGGLGIPLLVTGAWTIGLLMIGISLQGRFDRVFADLL
jgi:lipopolysaccharide transport system permease protein